MAADPRVSAGARLERTAFVNFLNRELKKLSEDPDSDDITFTRPILLSVLTWVKGRRKRYDSKRGGLGRKR